MKMNATSNKKALTFLSGPALVGRSRLWDYAPNQADDHSFVVGERPKMAISVSIVIFNSNSSQP